MTTRRTRTPFLLIALAIVAVLSSANVASACSSSADAPARPRGCCADRAPASCGCCGQSKPTAPRAEPPPAVVQDDARASLTTADHGSSCECRASQPAAPAGRTEASASVASPDALPLAATSRPARPTLAASSRSPAPDPAGRRLYLRIAHLLI